MAASEWTTTEYAWHYLSRADAFPHRTEGEAASSTTFRRRLGASSTSAQETGASSPC